MTAATRRPLQPFISTSRDPHGNTMHTPPLSPHRLRPHRPRDSSRRDTADREASNAFDPNHGYQSSGSVDQSTSEHVYESGASTFRGSREARLLPGFFVSNANSPVLRRACAPKQHNPADARGPAPPFAAMGSREVFSATRQNASARVRIRVQKQMRNGIKLNDGTLLTTASVEVVPVEGIEPPLLAEHDFESCASTSSATRACAAIYIRRPARSPKENRASTPGLLPPQRSVNCCRL